VLSPASLKRFLPSLERAGNPLRDGWDRLHRLPGGKRAFSRLVGLVAPYTGTVGARIVELRAGHAEVLLDDRPWVRNHLRSIHAVALVNLAELAGNIAVAYSLPDDARFIVAGLSIEYVKKARGQIRASCDIDVGEGSSRRELAVPVVMSDAGGDVVARATLRTLIGPKRPVAEA
jgi:acyl-coenzyme A thioesterase PaaI-like protein